MPEMDGPFIATALQVGWATAGITKRGTVVIVLADTKTDEEAHRLTFEMTPRLAVALHVVLGQAIAMVGGNEEEKH